MPTRYPSSLTDVLESYEYAGWSAQYMYLKEPMEGTEEVAASAARREPPL